MTFPLHTQKQQMGIFSQTLRTSLKLKATVNKTVCEIIFNPE